MKYGLIGCGRISDNHIIAAKNNNLDIVAICDIDISKAKKQILKYDLGTSVKVYENYIDLLENEKPELAAIATESGKHAKIALDCIESGCNVIIEKPIALSLKDADEIIEQSKKAGVKVCVCHQNRFNKSIRMLRKAVESNRFGKIFYGTAQIRWNRDEEYYRQAPWRGTWEQDGGALMNQCIHNIDLLRWMLGDEIIEVVGFTDKQNHESIQAEDLGMSLVKFKNGSFGMIEGTTNIYPKNLEETLCLFGKEGTVKIGGKSVNLIEEWMFSDGLDSLNNIKGKCDEMPANVYGFGHSQLYEDVVDSINNNRTPYIDAYAGRNALELVLAIYKSSKENRAIRLPLEECNTMDFKDNFIR